MKTSFKLAMLCTAVTCIVAKAKIESEPSIKETTEKYEALSNEQKQRTVDNTVKLPDAQTLNERLCAAGFDHFVEKTKIDQKLANRELHPLGVAVAVETHLYNYNQNMKQPDVAIIMQMRRPELVQIILADYPEAIEELKDMGLLQ